MANLLVSARNSERDPGLQLPNVWKNGQTFYQSEGACLLRGSPALVLDVLNFNAKPNLPSAYINCCFLPEVYLISSWDATWFRFLCNLPLRVKQKMILLHVTSNTGSRGRCSRWEALPHTLFQLLKYKLRNMNLCAPPEQEAQPPCEMRFYSQCGQGPS